MRDLYLHALLTDDAGLEEPAATRERLKGKFPAGATRRMTQLGLVVGAAFNELLPTEDDTVIYASEYGETRALEGYLDSFPTASPTLFQTSIHPSAVQQALIGRQQAVREFFPLTGRAQLVASALGVAFQSVSPRVLLCGGEERGTWLLERGVASPTTFAFACALSRDPTNAQARLTLTDSTPSTALAPPTPLSPLSALSAQRPSPPASPPSTLHAVPPADSAPSTSHFPLQRSAGSAPTGSALTLPIFFAALHARRPLDVLLAPDLHLRLSWS